MKLLRYLPLLFVVFGLNACMWGAPKTQPTTGITTDTLAYTWQTINQKANDCGNKPDSTCTIFKVKYPLFKDQAKLNDSVKHKLTVFFSIGEKSDTSLNSLAKHYFDAYYKDIAKNKRAGMIYNYDVTANVIRQDSDITTLQINGYTYQGGAHGGSLTQFINWDTKADKNLTLSDIFTSGYQDKLIKVADTIFRKNEKLSDTSSLARDYFFKDGKFALNDNFLITPMGIRFLYNEYEIKPYAAGQTELVIPYSKIKSLLLPHTVIAQYIK
jgi:hypothetical protein